MASDAVRGAFEEALRWVVLGVEVLAAVALLAGVSLAAAAAVRSRNGTGDGHERFRQIRRRLGQSLLLALELLVVADILQTIAIEMTLRSLGVLGVLVAIRTFVSLAIEVEVEGQWPWRRSGQPAPRQGGR